MLESEVEKLIAERMPEWATATCERIDAGHSENCFLLTLAGRAAVLKFDESPRAEFLATRIQEAMIQRQAFEEGLAPAVLYVDVNCILTDFVDADVSATNDFQNCGFLHRLGKLIRRVHSLPPFGIRFNGPLAARTYARKARGSALAERCVRCVEALPEAPVVLSHNDIVAGNVLDDGRLRLLDWEFAADNSPPFDLAMVVAYHELDPEQTDALVAGYGGDTELAQSLPTFVRASHALNWLWLAAEFPDQARQPGVQERLVERLEAS